MNTHKELEFPAVTICAYSPFWKNQEDDPTLLNFKNLFELNEDLEGALNDLLQPVDTSHQTTVALSSNDDDDDTKRDVVRNNCIKPFVHLYPNDAQNSSRLKRQVEVSTSALNSNSDVITTEMDSIYYDASQVAVDIFNSSSTNPPTSAMNSSLNTSTEVPTNTEANSGLTSETLPFEASTRKSHGASTTSGSQLEVSVHSTTRSPVDGRAESSTPFDASEVPREEDYDDDELRKIFEDDGIRVDSGDERKNGTRKINNETVKVDDFLSMMFLTSSYSLRDFREYLNLADAISDINKSIQHCSFNDVPCNPDDFRVKNDSNYGQCLTYNYKGDKRVSRSGSSNALLLKLTWNALNEFILLAPAKGFRITLHHPKSEPDPLGEGFDVGLNWNSYVGMRKMSFERLRPDTGGDCAFDSYLQERFDQRIFKVSDGTKYSKMLCLELCKLWRIRQNATTQCYLKSPLLQNEVNVSEYCNRQARMKSVDILKMINKDEDYLCSCPQPCTEERYQWSLSTAQTVPQHAWLLDLIAWMRVKKGTTLDKNILMTETYCKQPTDDASIAVVNIYYETMTTERIAETPMFSVVSFIGTLGGLLGLYAGLSFVSVLEVLEWMLDLVLYGWRKPEEKLGRKRVAIITCIEPLELERTSTKMEALGSGASWGEMLHNYRPHREAQRAGFDIVFSDQVIF
ncbi:unnamed protein product [Darwinula stevensoni]|uniref:Uncharacterized protein n=1 Tax=Darwinula stevensoni TaxID=69355 RepID=A0A7R9A642_9CRUS|nr:unnamed protein product [Darwinula stevensoni]CAG0893375.1 unnamed protein product [Darwinula stevensoni]